MRKVSSLLILVLLITMGCVNTGRYNTQKGAAVGAGVGALMGQAIGRNTEATLIGTGVGTLLGAIVGNLEDQRAAEHRDGLSQYEAHEVHPVEYRAPEPQIQTGPPGEWVTVPGRWERGRWIPAHQEWRPVQPD